MVIITAKPQKLDAKKQLTSVGKIAQMTVAQSFMFFFLHDRVQRVSVLVTRLFAVELLLIKVFSTLNRD